MPKLQCTAATCVYNDAQLCTKGDIKVTGADAKYADETSCASFRERTGDSAVNSAGCGCKTIDVDCKACDCVHNASEKCAADSIQIAGANACECRDTKCGTFSCK